MRESVPFPIERISAVLRLKASMSLNWRFSVPDGPTDSQFRPWFVVRNTVPRLPLVQTVRSLTTERPRSRAAEPVGVSSQR
jgi:hypothetical protein